MDKEIDMNLLGRHAIKRKSAFTLIELLVVIAIIAILAAILFPVFASAREKARQATCQSNLKQIGLAVLQYNEDYDEHYPDSVTERYAASDIPGYSPASVTACGDTPNAAEASPYSIREVLFPYTKSDGIWHDPDQSITWKNTHPSEPGLSTDTSGATNGYYYTDYGFNFDESVWSGGGATQPPAVCVPNASLFTTSGRLNGFGFNGNTTLAAIGSTSTFILAVDTERQGTSNPLAPASSRGSVIPQDPLSQAGVFLPNNPFMYSDGTPVVPTSNGNQASVIERHSGASEYLFADGHVKFLQPQLTWTSYTSNYWVRQQQGQ
jgi:prepilin-type N-terminal cleavage/methylation domain-containing protein/prepilin-type processing-associated H-X9-DG protein